MNNNPNLLLVHEICPNFLLMWGRQRITKLTIILKAFGIRNKEDKTTK
jgi:hypothetical protein